MTLTQPLFTPEQMAKLRELLKEIDKARKDDDDDTVRR